MAKQNTKQLSAQSEGDIKQDSFNKANFEKNTLKKGTQKKRILRNNKQSSLV